MTEQPQKPLPKKPLPGHANDPVDHLGQTYLHLLCAANAPVELIREAVLELGAWPDATGPLTGPPLADAIDHAAPEVVACLLKLGASPRLELLRNRIFNAAGYAIQAEKPEALDAILKNGGGRHVNEPGGMGHNGAFSLAPCLHLAVEKKSARMIEALIKAGALIDARHEPDDETPLMRAARGDDANAVRLLERGGADMRLKDAKGKTALHHAIENDAHESANVLLQRGADINTKDGNGNTPLMLAARNDCLVMVNTLLSGGADPTLTNAFNQTAYNISDIYSKINVRKPLRSAEEKARQTRFEQAYKKNKR